MVFWNCSKSRWRWYFGTAARAGGDGISETYLELIEMVLLELLQEQTQRYFGNAAGADRDDILDLQQERMVLVFWTCSKSKWRWYFGTAARANVVGILELQQEQRWRWCFYGNAAGVCNKTTKDSCFGVEKN